MGYNRRHFIGNSLAVTTALLLPALNLFGSSGPSPISRKKDLH